MGKEKEIGSQKGFLLVVVLLVGVAIIASYFNSGVEGNLVIRRPMGATSQTPSSLGSSTSVSELSQMCATQSKLCDQDHYSFYSFNNGESFFVKAKTMEEAEKKCGELIVKKGKPILGTADKNGNGGPVACPGCDPPFTGCTVTNLHLWKGVRHRSALERFRCDSEENHSGPLGTRVGWRLYWTCTACELVDGAGCTNDGLSYDSFSSDM